MTTLGTQILVTDGGATGAGVTWDAALRRFEVVLVDRADLAEGTSGRFSGLPHSGGRYVVTDHVATDECVAENRDAARHFSLCGTWRRVLPSRSVSRAGDPPYRTLSPGSGVWFR